MIISRVSCLLVFFVAVLCLVSCAVPAAKKPRITLTLIATTDLNPDINGRPSPLAVTVYQLANISSFKKSDFMSLAENGKAILGMDLVAVNNLTIRPGQTLKLDCAVGDDEKAFAIVAGYRVIDDSGWQLIHEYPRAKKGFFSKFKGSDVPAYKIRIEKNKMKFDSLPKEH